MKENPEYSLGVDLGGTTIKAGYVTEKGRIVREWRIDTEASKGGEHVVHRMLDLCREAFSDLPDGADIDQVRGIGIGAPGVFNYETGALVAGAVNIPGLDGTPVRSIFEDELGVPTFVDNDANVFALAEARWGAGKGTRHLIAYTLGTGVGGAVVINGKVFRGGWGFAGELGHITVDPEGIPCNCGNRGCLEMYASASNIAASARNMVEEGKPSSLSSLKPEEITCKAVGDAAEEGDPLAREVIERAAYYLTIGIAGAVIVVNPEAIVIGGGGAFLGERLFGPIRQGLRTRVYHQPVREVPVFSARFTTDSGIIGAGALAFSEGVGRQSVETAA